MHLSPRDWTVLTSATAEVSRLRKVGLTNLMDWQGRITLYCSWIRSRNIWRNDLLGRLLDERVLLLTTSPTATVSSIIGQLVAHVIMMSLADNSVHRTVEPQETWWCTDRHKFQSQLQSTNCSTSDRLISYKLLSKWRIPIRWLKTNLHHITYCLTITVCNPRRCHRSRDFCVTTELSPTCLIIPLIRLSNESEK